MASGARDSLAFRRVFFRGNDSNAAIAVIHGARNERGLKAAFKVNPPFEVHILDSFGRLPLGIYGQWRLFSKADIDHDQLLWQSVRYNLRKRFYSVECRCSLATAVQHQCKIDGASSPAIGNRSVNRPLASV